MYRDYVPDSKDFTFDDLMYCVTSDIVWSQFNPTYHTIGDRELLLINQIKNHRQRE